MEQICCRHHHTEIRKSPWKPYLLPGAALVMLLAGIGGQAAEVGFFNRPCSRFLWYLLAYLLVGIPVLKEAGRSICRKEWFNEFTLMGIATLGAFYIGEYPEGVAVMLFYTVGEIFQDKAVQRARRNIRALLDVRPETARVIREDRAVVLIPGEVQVGEVIEVQAGERVPLDGKLLTEVAAFDTAALTGESIPRHIRRGEEVLAGMVVTDRVVRIEVIRPEGQSALARILTLVEEAAGRKAPAELFIRKFARIYTPAVTIGALLILGLPGIYAVLNPAFSYVFNDWLYRALIFLVISCPCALVISVPLGYFGGIGAASGAGILFKGGNYLDAITKINTVVFDKTGTLTEGVFEVQQIEAEGGIQTGQLAGMLAALESRSNHPVAKAVVAYARKTGVEEYEGSDIQEWAGYGLRGLVNGQEVLAGNTRLLDRSGISYPEELKRKTGTVVCCALNGKYTGYLLLADRLKEDARQVVWQLKRMGIRKCCLLSGDKEAIVAELAAELGMDEYAGELLPEDKVKRLEQLKETAGVHVAFVGDGINDAPVLAMSHVGIAMGGLGSDAAIETADVVIQNDRPSKVAEAIRIGRITRRTVWQNIVWAVGVKVLVLLLGALGLATLWEAVFADVGVALIAVFNAVWIQKRVKSRKMCIFEKSIK